MSVILYSFSQKLSNKAEQHLARGFGLGLGNKVTVLRGRV